MDAWVPSRNGPAPRCPSWALVRLVSNGSHRSVRSLVEQRYAAEMAGIRTTVALEPDLCSLLLQRSKASGASLDSVVNDAIRAGLGSRELTVFKTRTVAMGRPRVDLDHALRLAGQLDDAGEHARGMETEARANLTEALRPRPRIGAAWLSLAASVREEFGGVDLPEVERRLSRAVPPL